MLNCKAKIVVTDILCCYTENQSHLFYERFVIFMSDIQIIFVRLFLTPRYDDRVITFTIEEGAIWKMRSIFRKNAQAATEKAPESQWVSIRTMLMKVLGRFPEAKAAVVEGLVELIGPAERVPTWAT